MSMFVVVGTSTPSTMVVLLLLVDCGCWYFYSFYYGVTSAPGRLWFWILLLLVGCDCGYFYSFCYGGTSTPGLEYVKT
ncbi:hypothetical protein CDAR_443651 [Caerostris darwini]|uniref:Transmembrane protein n=1 Tax=Caerostris darwini TaxID=1538125 RepID=A0AAV4TSD7_9ARAC|nr:hypothetical protein CDAR_443651 [Caerostris darwini]